VIKAQKPNFENENSMRVIVKKWGNTAVVRIPPGIMQAASLSLGDSVEVREEDGRIIIEPIRQVKYDLIKLLSGISKKNLHDEVYFSHITTLNP
jgi:antitoxin MazE